MSPLPNRQALEAMKRVDLQRLCKDYGVKANLKTEALIDLLLDASQPAPPRSTPIQPPQRVASMRRSSRAGTRARGTSSGSVIIHDTDEEEEDHQDEDPAANSPEPEPVLEAPRTRKAKETQTRLGVGRPVVVGGSGARAVTKSGSVSRGSRRGKSSRSIKPVEETIIEEDPESEVPHDTAVESPHAGPSGTSHEQPAETTSAEGSLASLQVIDKHVAEALRPLHEQMQSLKSELQRLKDQVSETANLQLQVQTLKAEVEELRGHTISTRQLEAEVSQLKASLAHRPSHETNANSDTTSRFQSPPKASGSRTLPTDHTTCTNPRSNIDSAATPANSSGSRTAHATSRSNLVPVHPGVAPIMLGKRHRDSTGSNVTGVFDAGNEDQLSESELEKKVPRPTKKRAKFDQTGEPSSTQEGSSSQPEPDSTEPEAPPLIPRGPSFTVYSEPSSPPSQQSISYIDPPPPTDHLPDFFAPPSPPSIPHSGPTTSTAHASENQNPFSFSFNSMVSTPANSLYPMTMPSFPYPEPPQSPSPAGPNRHHDPGHLYGPSSNRPQVRASSSRSGSGTSDHAFVNPAALLGSSDTGKQKEREMTSNEVAAGLGLTTVRTAEPESGAEAGPMKKTMYGTELDGDTRFGDFGVEGVATGFWAGGRF